MSTTPKRIVFDRYTSLRPRGNASFVYSNTPIVQIDAIIDTDYVKDGKAPVRNERQAKQLADRTLRDADIVFGSTLTWPYRGYTVATSTNQGVIPGRPGGQPLGTTPDQYVSQERRQLEINGASTAVLSPTASPQRLCLFNVIVALEWYPDADYVQQLQWAFRRASDFLYDVTDGYMAFGQVVFGGPEIMDGADIQIMASNRLLPRSWVNGLHDANKYMPIRAGRGIWHKNSRFSIPWDEPEAYRTLIHEWGHYALELKDAYLDTVDVVPAHLVGFPDAPPAFLIDKTRVRDQQLLGSVDQKDNYTIVFPQIRLPIESIMATLEGTSELVPHKKGSSQDRKQEEWEKVARKDEFLFLHMPPDHQPISGPIELPLPFPHIQDLTAQTGGNAMVIPAADSNKAPTIAQPPAPDPLLTLRLPDEIRSSHCWVYVIKGTLLDPKQVIAPGTLDELTKEDGLRLFGASQGDVVVLIDEGDKGEANVWQRTIDTDFERLSTDINVWTSATPNPFPMIDVLPTLDKCSDLIPKITVHVGPASAAQMEVWVFPIGTNPQGPEGRKKVTSLDQPFSVPTLDGHVLVRWAGGNKLMICTYSQGGGPSTSFPVPPNPIAAGSSEGNVMLFFNDKDDGAEGEDCDGTPGYNHVRIVTTLLHGLPTLLPDKPGSSPDGSLQKDRLQPRSYAFSITSTEKLPDLNPTLLMFYDKDSDIDDADLQIHRYVGGEQEEWVAIATYAPTGAFFVATPLVPDTAPRLFANEAPRVERFRLFLTPREKANKTNQPIQT